MGSTIVADGIVDRLVDWDVKRTFSYAGDGVDPILATLHRQQGRIDLVTASHEEMAAFMATGHAKYGGGVGVCLATQGPGAIHLLNGLYDAKLDRRPVVAIVRQVSPTALARFNTTQGPVDLTLVDPVVVELSADVAWDGQSFRHILRFVRPSSGYRGQQRYPAGYHRRAHGAVAVRRREVSRQTTVR